MQSDTRRYRPRMQNTELAGDTGLPGNFIHDKGDTTHQWETMDHEVNELEVPLCRGKEKGLPTSVHVRVDYFPGVLKTHV